MIALIVSGQENRDSAPEYNRKIYWQFDGGRYAIDVWRVAKWKAQTVTHTRSEMFINSKYADCSRRHTFGV